MTRDEAITWLRSVGRNASARDWVLGATIVITMGEPDTSGEITVWPGALYVCPLADGRWKLHDVSGGFEEEEEHGDLATAVRAADAYIKRWENERAKRSD